MYASWLYNGKLNHGFKIIHERHKQSPRSWVGIGNGEAELSTDLSDSGTTLNMDQLP